MQVFKISFVKTVLTCFLLTAVIVPVEAAANYKKELSFYIDAIRGNDNNSGLTISHAWKTLAKVNTTTFLSGSHILFKRGQTWQGQLNIKSSGGRNQPIIINAYGSGAKQVIAGNGVANGTIYVNNQQYIEFHNLSVTNYNSSEENSLSLVKWEQKNKSDFANTALPPQVNNHNMPLYGIYITAEDTGEVNHVHLVSLEVHGVNGYINQEEESKNNGGIYFKISGTKKPTFFNDVLIDSCNIHDVDRTGIMLCNSTWSTRTLKINTNWTPSRNVILRNCRFNNTGANALIVRVATNPLIEHNVFDHCAIKGSGNAAFSFSCDSAVWQYNECRYTKANVGDRDAGGIDADYKTRHTILQYNYVHNNDYGILITGGPDSFNDETIVRYNIFENDGAYAHPTHSKCVIRVSGSATNTHIYNNVIYVGPTQKDTKIISHEVWKTSPINTTYQNNIVYNLSENALFDFETSTGNNFDHNLYYGNAILNIDEAAWLHSDPLFVKPGFGAHGYKLKSGSPAIGSGIVISQNGNLDYFGNRIRTEKINIGIYNNSPVK